MLFRFLLKKLFNFRQKTDVEMVKPFLEHLEDLRWTLVKMAAALGVAMFGSFIFRAELAGVVEQPLYGIGLPGGMRANLQTLGPIDSMSISINLAFYAGLILAFPFLLYFLAQFTLPALNQKEKVYVLPAVGVGFMLFLTGVLVCFKLILPTTLRWLFNDSIKMGFRPDWRVTDYFGFATQFVLIFGLMFELPVVITVLVKIGILNATMLRKTRAYAVVLILVGAVIIAPTPDPVTMAIVAGPMLLLYEACIWIAWAMERRDRRLAGRIAAVPVKVRDLDEDEGD